MTIVANLSKPFSVANPGNVPVFKTLSQCMKQIDDDDEVGDVWIVGGFGIYQVCSLKFCNMFCPEIVRGHLSKAHKKQVGLFLMKSFLFHINLIQSHS